jgi:ribosomal protein S18 acetylase RimI-like enzyme
MLAARLATHLAAHLADGGEIDLVREITVAAYGEYEATLDQLPLPVTEDYAPRIAAGQVWVVTVAGRPVGAMTIEREADHLLIFSLAVLPACKGAGIGRWMRRFVEDLARSAGMPELRLFTNPLMVRNIRIYREHGFVETGRRPNPHRPGWMFVDMAKQVDGPEP